MEKYQQRKNTKKSRFILRRVIPIVTAICVLIIAIFVGFELKSDLKVLPTSANGEEAGLKKSPFFVSKDYKGIYNQIIKNYNNPQQMIGGTLSESNQDKMMKSEDKNAADYSRTNEQVEGVFEADLVKNNGEYVYAISKKTSEVNISKLTQGSLGFIGKIKIEDAIPDEIYLVDKKLVIISLKSENTYLNSSEVNPTPYKDIAYMATSVMIKIYDVSDPKNPVFEQKFEQTGKYNTSRVVGNQLFIITSQYSYSSPKSEKDYDAYIPSVTKNGKKVFIKPEDITIINSAGNLNYAVVSSVKIDDTKTEIRAKAVLGGANTIYSSTKNLYITNNRWIEEETSDYNTSDIIKFSLNNGNIDVVAKTTIKGALLNQFSLDEFEGNLRVAVSIQKNKIEKELIQNYNPYIGGDKTLPSNIVIRNVREVETNNKVIVLDKDLKTIGETPPLAETETIYSARFMGEMCYIVTFRQVDPLFVISLKDPKNPHVKGELKIPGFSEYLHPLNENILIGIGKDADLDGRVKGFKISLFDVSNPEKPTEIASSALAGNVSETLVSQTHKAFMLDKRNNLVGLPFVDYSVNYTGGYTLIGIDEKGINKALLFLNDHNNNTSQILRSFYIDDTLFLYGDDFIKFYNISSLKKIMKEDKIITLNQFYTYPLN
jgi:inhibitor of cysteine peptidase